MENKGLLIVIAVILLGIFTVVAVKGTERSSEDRIADSIGEVANSVEDGVRETGEEIKDEIDDNTTSR